MHATSDRLQQQGTEGGPGHAEADEASEADRLYAEQYKGYAKVSNAYHTSAVSKAAVDTLARTWAAETATTPVKVMLVSPGPMRTRMRATAMPGRCMRNTYGPTEASITVTISEPLTGADRVPPIGRTIPGTKLYVLDAGLQPVPVGVIGELYAAVGL